MLVVWSTRNGGGFYSVVVTERLRSPDGSFEATVETWDGGALGANDRVYVQHWWARELVYHSKNLESIRWNGPDELVIRDHFFDPATSRFPVRSTCSVGLRRLTVTRGRPTD